MMSYKRNLISTLLHHSLMICSSSKALHNEILKLKKIFWSSWYQFICTVTRKEFVCVFLLFGFWQKVIRNQKCLLNVTEITLPCCKSNIVFKSSAKIGKQFPFKDVLPKNLCSFMVYNLKRNSCNTIYYDKTKRYVYVRTAKHVEIWHLANVK